MITYPPCQLLPPICPVIHKAPAKYIQNYVIDYESPMGSGNFSNVYRSYKISEPHIPLVVKLVNLATMRQQKLQNLLWAQIQIMRATNHKNVISCKDVFWDETWCYIFSDFYQGGNLESQLKKMKYVTEAEMIPIIRDVFDGLSYLQKNRIIHRDIKAANIFLKGARATVADMGFAKFFYQPFYDLHIGSPPFMPPQALTKGYYCNKTDVWAFGILLFQIFHGESPFAKCFDINDLNKKVYIPLSVVNIRYDLSVQMKQLILSCLQIDIQKRPKFCDIEKSWYFKKLFNTQNSRILVKQPFSYRSPLKTINSNIGQITPINISQTEKKRKNQTYDVLKSPTFNRINKLKSDIKKKKEENAIVSVMTQNDIQATLSKISINQQNQDLFHSHNKSISDKANLDNQEDFTTQFSYKLVEKITFKQALKKVKNIRNYVVLSRTLKNRNTKICDIKDRLLQLSLNELNLLENKINNDQIKVNQKQKQTTYTKLNKLSKILIDYKHQIEKQLKRRQITTKQGNLSQQQQFKLMTSQLKRKMSNSKLSTLKTDIQYIIKSQYPFYSEDSKNIKEGEEYRKKLRQLIDQIKKYQKKSNENQNIQQKILMPQDYFRQQPSTNILKAQIEIYQ